MRTGTWDQAKDKTRGLNADDVRALFHYDEATGELRWAVRRKKVVLGSVAGYINVSDGYRYVGVNRREYLAHRLIWLWKTGEWPVCQIDHKNRKRSDNRWCNLREASNSSNNHNTNLRCDNTSGHKGVSKRGRKYRARINIHGREVNLGYFHTLAAAIEVRRAAESKYLGQNGT